MGNEEDNLEKLNKKIDDLLLGQLAETDALIRRIDEKMNEREIVEVLRKANSIVRLMCGRDRELYSEWRYRLIKVEDGKYRIFQGEEINVEPLTDLAIGEE